MAYRTYFCNGLGFFCEKQGRIIAAGWTDEKFVASADRHCYSLDESTFRRRMEGEGFSADDEEVFFEDPSGTFL